MAIQKIMVTDDFAEFIDAPLMVGDIVSVIWGFSSREYLLVHKREAGWIGLRVMECVGYIPDAISFKTKERNFCVVGGMDIIPNNAINICARFDYFGKDELNNLINRIKIKEDKMADNQKRFPEVEMPLSSPEYIYTAGYYRCADNIVPGSEKARNNFYVTVSHNDDTVYVYPWVYSRDLTCKEVKHFWKDEVTLGDFFPERIREFVRYSYLMGSNPLPVLRAKFPEFNFRFQDGISDMPDTPLPDEGSTIFIDKQGNIRLGDYYPTYEVEADDPVGMPELAIPQLD